MVWGAGLAALAFATTVERSPVRIEVTQVDRSVGQLLVVLFNQEEGFPSDPERAWAKLVLPASSGTTVAVFPEVPHGRWAAFVVHDEDGDYTCDLKRIVPMPAEPVGASRAAKGLFGPPKFRDAVFDVAGPTTERVVLVRY